MRNKELLKKRFTLELSSNVVDKLEKLAKKHQITKSEVIRKSLCIYDFLNNNVIENNGNYFTVLKDDGEKMPILIV